MGTPWHPVPECRGVYPCTWRGTWRWLALPYFAGRQWHAGYHATRELAERAAAARLAELADDPAVEPWAWSGGVKRCPAGWLARHCSGGRWSYLGTFPSRAAALRAVAAAGAGEGLRR